MTQAPPESRWLRDRLRLEMGSVRVVGHRGAMGYCPENTMSSFQRALELGADWIELDVQLTRDGALAVIHDQAVDRTTDGHGLVKDHTLAELEQLDAGAWFGPDFVGQRIPTLGQVLDWARPHSTIVDIEIKNGPQYYAGIEEAVVTTLHRAGMAERAIVISFDHAAVQRVKVLDERIATGVVYAARPIDGGVGMAKQARADVLVPRLAEVTQQEVQKAHAAGLAVAPWDTSDIHELQRLLAAGVDAIGTNHPDVLRNFITRATARTSPDSRGTGSTAEPLGTGIRFEAQREGGR